MATNAAPKFAPTGITDPVIYESFLDMMRETKRYDADLEVLNGAPFGYRDDKTGWFYWAAPR